MRLSNIYIAPILKKAYLLTTPFGVPSPKAAKLIPGAAITSRLHVQVCVLNPECIKGYFLPRPIEKFNPYLNR